VLLIDNLLITSLIPILLFEYFKDCLPLRTDDHILEWSIIPPFDVVNDVNQDFSLKYSNNKMGINDVINKLSINNTRANLLY
jgi:hypothetical protein